MLQEYSSVLLRFENIEFYGGRLSLHDHDNEVSQYYSVGTSTVIYTRTKALYTSISSSSSTTYYQHTAQELPPTPPYYCCCCCCCCCAYLVPWYVLPGVIGYFRCGRDNYSAAPASDQRRVRKRTKKKQRTFPPPKKKLLTLHLCANAVRVFTARVHVLLPVVHVGTSSSHAPGGIGLMSLRTHHTTPHHSNKHQLGRIQELLRESASLT